MYFLRFTNTANETNSKDWFTGTELNGVCAFEMNCSEDELFYTARQLASSDDTYLKFYNGNFIIFQGSKIGENPNVVGVLAKIDSIVESGQMVWNERTNSYKIV